MLTPILALTLTAPPPNVVMIVGDDMGWTDYGFMGHPAVRTPHLDKLAGESLTFVNGYVPTSLCRASLATLLTGLYAHQHRICCNDPPAGVDRSLMLPFLRDAPTVPRLLRDKAGYRSLQTGKFWEGHYTNGGFTHGMTETGRHGQEGLAIGRKTMKPVFDFIDGRGDKPFFVWYAPMMPHLPHDPPQRLLKQYTAAGRDIREAKYFAMCEWFDETVGDLLGYLDQKQLAADTLVVYVVDNGWVQATGPPQPRDFMLTRSKNTPYDSGVRTPIMVRWPGKIRPMKCDDLVNTVDLAPTILAACGTEVPPRMSGLNLLTRSTGPLPRDAVFGEIFQHNCVKLGEPATSLTHRWVRHRDWKLIVPADGTAVELYDMKVDPFEKTNLAANRSADVERLRAALDSWWKPN